MLEMDPAGSCTSEYDDEMTGLQSLLEAFSSVFSLEEIASAYCRGGRDVNKAGEILYQLQEDNSNGIFHESNGEMGVAQSEESLHEKNAENSTLIRKNSKGSKPKKLSVSMGTVSGVLGKSYAWPTSSLNESVGSIKPLKLEVRSSLMDELEGETVVSNIAHEKELMSNKDVEEFLFSMLGDGFKLKKDVIREVLGHCGYDVKKSVGQLLVLSESTLHKGKEISCSLSKKEHEQTALFDQFGADNVTEKLMGKCPKMKSSLHEESYPTLTSTRRNIAELPNVDHEKANLPREVLEALFNAPERSEEEPKRKRLEFGLNRTRVIGQKAVTKPFDDIASESSTDIAMPQKAVKDVVDEEDTYLFLRSATKHHWDAMRAYYEAAVDAFTEGDRAKADYLLEQGKYYNKMAREADEKSAGEMYEKGSTNGQSELPLDLHTHHAKEAIRLLKFHLRNLASIPSFRYLKVVVNTDAEDTTKGKRKRLVIKLLEKESIKWIEEEGNPGTILIQLDVINPNKLSFVKDQE